MKLFWINQENFYKDLWSRIIWQCLPDSSISTTEFQRSFLKYFAIDSSPEARAIGASERCLYYFDLNRTSINNILNTGHFFQSVWDNMANKDLISWVDHARVQKKPCSEPFPKASKITSPYLPDLTFFFLTDEDGDTYFVSISHSNLRQMCYLKLEGYSDYYSDFTSFLSSITEPYKKREAFYEDLASVFRGLTSHHEVPGVHNLKSVYLLYIDFVLGLDYFVKMNPYKYRKIMEIP